MPFLDYFMIADSNGANLRDAIAGSPPARGFDVDDNVVLVRIEAVVDAPDLGRDAGRLELP